MKKLLLIVPLLLASCTNADIAQMQALGSSATITCYSGGKIIYQGESTGKVSTEAQSDGWYFQEKGTHDLIRVSGQCVIRNKT